MPSVSFTDYVVYSSVPWVDVRLVVRIECHDGPNTLAVGVLEFYDSAEISGPTAELSTDLFILRYPIARFNEVYQLLRDGARKVSVNPPGSGILVASTFADI